MDLTGTSGSTKTADNTGAGGIVTLKPAAAGNAIDLGGPDAAGTLGLTDPELDTITASVLRIGDSANTGGITISAAISPANTNTLHLITDVGISQSTGADTITVDKLALSVGANSNLILGANTVSKFAADIANGATLKFKNSKNLTIDSIDGVVGVTGGAGTAYLIASGKNITQTTAGTVTVSKLELKAGSVALNNTSNDVATIAGMTTSASSGAFSYIGLNDLIVGTVGSVHGITTKGGDVSLEIVGANNTLTLTNDVDTTNGHPAGANVTYTADKMALTGATNAGTGGVATLKPKTATQVIGIGSTDAAGILGLTETELNTISAATLVVGDTANTGGIVISNPITLASASVPTLYLITGAGIDNTASSNTITVDNLVLTAVTGIGSSSNPLETQISRLNAYNSTSGDINISNTGDLIIDDFYIGNGYGIENDAGKVTINNTGSIDIPGTNGYGV